MGYAILFLFASVALLSFFEKFLGKYRLILFIAIGLLLVLLAGTREVGIDPDSENYEYSYQNYYSEKALGAVEFSFLFFSSIFNVISNDVHVIFLFYAFLGVLLKFFAIRKYSDTWFLPLLIYLSFYYELHELTQIRTGVSAGFFLLAIKPIAEKKRMKAFLLLLVAIFFHISAIVFLPLLFLSNKEIGARERLFLLLIIPVGYFIFIAGYAVSLMVDIPYIGDKLTVYQAAEEFGQSDVSVNVFSPLFLFTVMIYIYLHFFQNAIIEHNPYYPLMMKIFGIGIVFFLIFAFLPVLSQRLSYLFRIVTIILYANVYYTIKPRWAAILAVILLSFVYINYALPYISFNLLWEG